MKIYQNNFPWTHWIIDNFVEQKDVMLLSNFCQQHIEQNKGKHHYLPEFLPTKLAPILQKTIDKMPTIIKDLNYKSPRKHKRTHALGHLAINTPGYSFQPHCDDETKIWTFVTYIGPYESIGTYVMSSMTQQDKVQIPWKPGRCLVFAGNNGETWHSYESGNNWRATITAYMNTDKNWGK